jgi:hypothetical protein
MQTSRWNRSLRLVTGFAGLFAVLLITFACSTKPASAPAEALATAKKPQSPALWGDMTPVVSVKELMQNMIDPIADYIFDSVKIVQTKAGTTEVVPKTDADWDRILTGGVALAEAAALLKIPRPFAPAGDLNNSVGPDAVELAPAEILAKVQRDPVEWNARIQALRNVGLEVIDIVKRKDVKELWDASENLDQACEACHRSYWYPKEDEAFYEKLRRRLEEHNATIDHGRKSPN